MARPCELKDPITTSRRLHSNLALHPGMDRAHKGDTIPTDSDLEKADLPGVDRDMVIPGQREVVRVPTGVADDECDVAGLVQLDAGRVEAVVTSCDGDSVIDRLDGE